MASKGLLIALALSSVLGCSTDSRSHRAGAVIKPPMAGKPGKVACAERVRRFERWARPLGTYRSGWTVTGLQLAELPELAKSSPLTGGVVLALRREGVTFADQDVATSGDPRVLEAGKLRQQLAAQRQRLARLAQHGLTSKTKLDVLLAIEPAVPWQRVAAAATALKASGVTRLGFMFIRKQRLVAPPASRNTARIRQATSQQALVQLTADIVVHGCSTAAKAMGRVRGTDPAKATVAFIRAVTDALLTCSCRQDLASVKELLFRLIVRGPEVGVVWRQLSVGGGAKITAATTVPWSTAATRIIHGPSEIQIGLATRSAAP